MVLKALTITQIVKAVSPDLPSHEELVERKRRREQSEEARRAEAVIDGWFEGTFG
jgi:hypothetical protein